MSIVTQLTAVSLMNLRSIPHRIGPSLVIVFGIAGVVAVLVSMLAMSTGFLKTIENGARADRIIFLSQGAESEAASALSRSHTVGAMSAPGIKRSANGKPAASAETLILARVKKRANGSDAYLTLRGVGPEIFAVRPNLKLIAGRMFNPAVHELIVGKSAQAQFSGLDIGSRITLREGDWTVVGVFSSDGDPRESELIADAETVISAYARSGFNSVTALLDSEESLESLRDAVGTDPTLLVDVKQETKYVASLTKPLNRILSFVSYTVAGIMGVGALFGALNTMYSAVSTRTVEIATLRAIGYGGGAVVVSVLLEALILASMGAIIGIAIAYFAFHGQTISGLGSPAGRSQLVYSLTVTPASIGIAAAFALVIGMVGGLWPAVRTARLPVASALRAS